MGFILRSLYRVYISRKGGNEISHVSTYSFIAYVSGIYCAFSGDKKINLTQSLSLKTSEANSKSCIL